MKNPPVGQLAPLCFNVNNLPSDYEYKYTLVYILNNCMSMVGRTKAMNDLPQILGIGRRMFEVYLYARKDDAGFNMTSDKLLKISDYLGVRLDDIITPNDDD